MKTIIASVMSAISLAVSDVTWREGSREGKGGI